MQKTLLSTADVARLFDVTETTVKRWADVGTLKCQKTPGGHRKFVIRNVVEFAENNNIEPSGVLSMPDKDGLAPAIQTAVLTRDFPALVHAFTEKALSTDRCDLFEYLSYLYEHKIPLCEIYDEILRPSLAEIGERWQRGDIGINSEHRASYETLDALARLQSYVRIKPATGKSAVLACLDEEMHEIGLRCASYLFDSEGWHTHYIGARTPARAIAAAVWNLRPAVLCLSTSVVENGRVFQEDLKELTVSAHNAGARVIVGGRGASGRHVNAKVVDSVCVSAKELVHFIESESK